MLTRLAATAAACLLALPSASAEEPGAGHAPCLAKGPDNMACVPGGEFVRGVDKDPFVKCFQFDRIKTPTSDAIPSAKVEVSTFYMDVTEVTYGAYTACREAGKCPKRNGPRYKDMNRPDQPFLGITWYDAVAYCEAHGKHLPTEAEWEKAARGTAGKRNPWGDDHATCDVAVIREKGKTSCGVRQKSNKASIGRPFVVKSKPVGPYGIYDMVGNAEEWVADWYSTNWKRCGGDCLGKDPLGPCGGKEPCRGHTHKVVRGGSWFWPRCAATGYHRRPHVPRNSPFHHFGFRCAASLEEAKALD